MTDEQWDAWASARQLWDVKTARRMRRNFTVAFVLALVALGAGLAAPSYTPWMIGLQVGIAGAAGFCLRKASHALREARLRESAPVPEHLEWYFKTTWLYRQRAADARWGARVATVKQRAKAVVGR